MREVVRFDVTFSVEDVIKVQKALMKRFKAGKDDPIKTVGLALCVAEIEVLMWKRMMAEYITTLMKLLRELGCRLRNGHRICILKMPFKTW